MRTRQLKFRVDDDLCRQLEEIAEKEDRSVAYVTRRLLREALEEIRRDTLDDELQVATG